MSAASVSTDGTTNATTTTTVTSTFTVVTTTLWLLCLMVFNYEGGDMSYPITDSTASTVIISTAARQHSVALLLLLLLKEHSTDFTHKDQFTGQKSYYILVKVVCLWLWTIDCI